LNIDVIGDTQISKLVSIGLLAAVAFATPAMADWYDRNGAVVDPSGVIHCIRAPDKGAFATAPYKRPPCAEATLYGTNAWRDSNGADLHPSRVVHCKRVPNHKDEFVCEPANWRD
jgi:hypothetical protein